MKECCGDLGMNRFPWWLHILCRHCLISLKVVLGHLGPEIDHAHEPYQGQPWMSKVVLEQIEHLGLAIGDVHRPC